MKRIDRRKFLEALGLGAAALSAPGGLLGMSCGSPGTAGGLPGIPGRISGILGEAPGMQQEGSPKDRRPPNILLVMADDLGYECLRCDGGTSYTTPHIDELARSGVRFTHCHANPLCTPSRVEIMTGRYNFRNYTEFGALDPGEITFGNVLRKAGYRTCVAGKWQLAARTKGKGTTPGKAGFDEHCLWQVHELGSRYWNPRIRENDRIRDDLEGRYGPEVFTDFIRSFMGRHRDRPFFAYYPMVLTHAPFLPTPESDAAEAKTGKTKGKSKKRKSDPAFFGDMVAYMDELVGRLVSRLADLGLREKTLVLFTGDNGTDRSVRSRMGERTIRGGKGKTIMAGTHVPLIANLPGTARAGAVCNDLVDFSDFLPTLAAAAGTLLPEGVTIDGRSFLPRILGKPGTPRKWVFCHYDPRHGPWKKRRFVMNEEYKLYGDGRFFDVLKDPLEEHPLDPETLTPGETALRKEFESVLGSMRKEPAPPGEGGSG